MKKKKNRFTAMKSEISALDCDSSAASNEIVKNRKIILAKR